MILPGYPGPRVSDLEFERCDQQIGLVFQFDRGRTCITFRLRRASGTEARIVGAGWCAVQVRDELRGQIVEPLRYGGRATHQAATRSGSGSSSNT